MVLPAVFTRVKEKGLVTGRGINPRDLVVFVVVAALTRQSQIAGDGGAAPAARFDVLDRKRLNGKPRLAAAILATPMCPLCHLEFQGGQSCRLTHAEAP